MKTRLAVLVVVVLLAGGLAGGGAALLPERAGGIGGDGPRPAPVPLVRGAAAVVCPGPETLAVPPGGDPVPAGGPVLVRALAAAVDPLGGVEAGGPGAPAPGGADVAASLRELSSDGPDGQDGAGGADGGTGSGGAGGSGGSGPVDVPATVLRSLPGGIAVAGQTLARAGATRLDATAPGDDTPPLLAAVQTTLATSGDLRGLATTGCAAAGSDIWLVGGGTGDGHRARLLLANPMSSPALVDVTVHGSAGRLSAPGGEGIVVPASGQVALFVDALAPGVAPLAVHVQTRSGRVTATLHDSVLRGLVPGGTDDVPAAAPAAKAQVVPGLSVQGGDAAHPSGPEAPGATAVRVAVPGPDEAIVRISLLGPTGVTELGARGVVTVPGGGVVDVQVGGVPDGDYAALVRADVPVVAGAVIGRASAGSGDAGTAADPGGKAPPADLGWSAATLPLAAPAAVALPAAATAGGAITATLSLTAPGAGARVVIQALGGPGASGAGQAVDVPAGGTLAVPVPKAAGVLIRPDGGGAVHAAVVLTAADAGGRMVSVIPVSASASGPGVRPVAVEDPRLGLAG